MYKRQLKGGVLYYDGQFDDARLALSLMRTLFDLGGTAVNYVRATGLTTTGGKVDGVTAQDALGGASFTPVSYTHLTVTQASMSLPV